MVRKRASPHRPDISVLIGPVRTCVGCRERTMKCELLRVTAGSDSRGHPAVVPDPDGTAPGRGAHLHPTTACYDLAVRRKAFTRGLRWTGESPGGLSATPVGEYVAHRAAQHEARARGAASSAQPAQREQHSTTTEHDRPTDRNWSSSS